MASPAEVLLNYLIDLKVLRTPRIDDPLNTASWPCNIGMLPIDGDNHVSCLDTLPVTFGKEQRYGERLTHDKVQFSLRASNYPAAWDKAQEIMAACDKIGIPESRGGAGEVVPVSCRDGDYYIRVCYVPQPFVMVEMDQQDRSIFVANMQLKVGRTS